jgi:MFS family permease
MSTPITDDRELRSNLRRIYNDALAFSIMVGAGETYLAAFVLALGMGEIAAGLIASIPMLAGAILQLISPAAVRLLGSHKKWVVICATAQAAAFIPLVIAALVGRIPVVAVFAIAAIYWGAGLATGPAWNTWVGTLVPAERRAAYFARRSRAAHVAVLVGLAGAGLTLQLADQAGQALRAFAAIFLFAGACRFISAWLLSRHTEPVKPDDEHRVVPMRELLSRARHSHDGKLLVFMLAMQTAVQISGPYFTPYMLAQIHMSYGQYLLLIATSYTARVLVMPMLGGLVQRIGSHRVLWYSGMSVIPLSTLWLASDHIVYLFFVQLTAGACWAAYEFVTFLLLFETIKEEERTSVLTTFNLFNAIAMVIGSTIGGFVLHRLGTDHRAYLAIFALSGVVRLTTLLLLRRAARAIPESSVPAPPVPVPTRIEAVRPNLGSLEKPILPGLPERRD